MIAREGDLDVEFAGNTTIENITAEGDLTVVTRGKSLEIENLGHIVDESVIPEDYFGPRDYGQKDGGYMGEDYRDEALPNNAELKALDINHNIRPTDELVDEGHEAWADSTVKVTNAVLDQGKLDITADHVIANGIDVDFGKNGYTKVASKETNPVIGSDGIPTGHAVRPDDVKETGRDELERNYYYHKGDGDGIFDGIPSHVDPDNGIRLGRDVKGSYVLVSLSLESDDIVLVSHHLREPVSNEIIGLLVIQAKFCKRGLQKRCGILTFHAKASAKIRLDVDVAFPIQV